MGLATALAKQDPDILQAIDADLDAPNDAVLLAG
jgi:MinD superfamily P-loop ATPase